MPTITLTEFLGTLISNPAFAITTALTLAVILVNGWTDAPNAIATCVSTRSMKPRTAILMAAVCNFAGVLAMTAVNATVAETVYNMVDFGGDAHDATVALCALFRHRGLGHRGLDLRHPHQREPRADRRHSGAAIALQGAAGIRVRNEVKVIYGLVLSTSGFVLLCP